MSILNHLIHTSETAEAFESFCKKNALRLLVIGIIWGILAVISVHFLYFDIMIVRFLETADAFCGLMLIPLLLAPPVICLSLSLSLFQAAKYIHPKCYELPRSNDK